MPGPAVPQHLPAADLAASPAPVPPDMGDGLAWLDALRHGIAELAAWCASAWDALAHWPDWATLWAWVLDRLNGGVNNVVEALLVLAAGALFAWWRRRRGRDRRNPASAASSAAMSPEIHARLCDLLLGLPGWNLERTRRNLVEIALGPEHPVAKNSQFEGSGQHVAAEVATACGKCATPDAEGRTPLCALLAYIFGEFGDDPARAAEVAALQALLDCA